MNIDKTTTSGCLNGVVFWMRKIAVIFIMVMAGILIAGCTGTNVTDPIIGSWRDTLLGSSQMEFTGDHLFYGKVIDDSYQGNWSQLSAGRYVVNFYNVNNNTGIQSTIIDYNSTYNMLFMENMPSIQYARVADKIQGNWTDPQRVSLLEFDSNLTYRLYVGYSVYNGTWSKINETCYYVKYMDASNSTKEYAQIINYLSSNNTIQFNDIPYVYYTRIS